MRFCFLSATPLWRRRRTLLRASLSLEGALSVAGPPPLRMSMDSRSVILSAGFCCSTRCCSLTSSPELGFGRRAGFKVVAYGFKQDSYFVLAKAPLVHFSRAGLRFKRSP